MTGHELSTALIDGTRVYGTAILSPSPLWPGMVASAGVDFVFIDTEHTPLDRETVSTMCHAFARCHVAPLVRIPSPDAHQARMVLDGGATGVIAPYVETPEEVRSLVSAVKYKPLKGKIMEGDSFPPMLEPGLAEYLKEKNREHLIIINIESVPAIESLDEILAVKGLDGILIGPHDLTCSLGIPEQYDHPLFINTVDAILEKARRRGVGAGVHCWDALGYEKEIAWVRKGANLIVHSNDLLLFRNTLQHNISRIRDSITQ